MNIIYMHHAERKNNSKLAWENPKRKEDDITESGVVEAEILAKRSKNLKVTAIYSSPYKRCMRTAEIINKYHNVPIITDGRFNEIMPNEHWKDLLIRNMAAIDDIVKNYKNDDTIICVTSGVNVSAFICYFYGIKPSNEVPWTQTIAISPISFKINKIV